MTEKEFITKLKKNKLWMCPKERKVVIKEIERRQKNDGYNILEEAIKTKKQKKLKEGWGIPFMFGYDDDVYKVIFYVVSPKNWKEWGTSDETPLFSAKHPQRSPWWKRVWCFFFPHRFSEEALEDR